MLNDDEYSIRIEVIRTLKLICERHADGLSINAEQARQLQQAVDDPNADYRLECFQLFG